MRSTRNVLARTAQLAAILIVIVAYWKATAPVAEARMQGLHAAGGVGKESWR